jgi:hypothetical protein
LTKEEIEYKRVIGGEILQQIVFERLNSHSQNNKDNLQDEKAEPLYQDHETEDNFFKLIKFLTNNCPENASLVKNREKNIGHEL